VTALWQWLRAWCAHSQLQTTVAAAHREHLRGEIAGIDFLVDVLTRHGVRDALDAARERTDSLSLELEFLRAIGMGR
jgi:hypothetical protein